MAEVCPLRQGQISDPAVCAETCQERWEQAVMDDVTAGPYDSYGGRGNQADDSQECRHLDAEFSVDALRAVKEQLREYVIVDSCIDCDAELGQQGYRFSCPRPLQK